MASHLLKIFFAHPKQGRTIDLRASTDAVVQGWIELLLLNRVKPPLVGLISALGIYRLDAPVFGFTRDIVSSL